MSQRKTCFLLTVDVEHDLGTTTETPAFQGVTAAIPQLLAPLCRETGMRPTYFVSSEVLYDRASVAALLEQTDCELAAYLPSDGHSGRRPRARGCNLARDARRTQGAQAEGELAALAELTELFRQQFGRRPLAFRAGGLGIGPRTGGLLSELGYRVDSSMIPGVAPEGTDGRAEPDVRGLSHHPYRVGRDGDVFKGAARQSRGPLLEVPITIVPATVIGQGTTTPTWLRPVRSTRQQLLRILDAAARDEDRGMPWHSLCMMLGSVELMAGAMSSTSTKDDVQRLLADVRSVAARATQLGFSFATVSEFERGFTRAEDAAVKAPQSTVRRVQPSAWIADGPHSKPWQVNYRTPEGAEVDVDTTLANHGVQPWFANSIRARAGRWDNSLAYAWLADNLTPEQSVLDIGCGVGANLEWLASRGLRDLSGCDLDPKAIAAGQDLAQQCGRAPKLWVDDGRTLQAAPARQYDAVCAMNWVQLVDDFDLHAFLGRVRELITDDGWFAMDYIDRDFDRNPSHHWLSSDILKPVHERAPSEYRSRYGAAEIRYELQRGGFEVVQETRNDEPIPKGVLFCRRNGKTVATQPSGAVQCMS